MNIKVCLLPDGDDPDSFARKHNATDYQAYINDHEVDFIRFKTNLLMEEAGKDPIKRASLISSIVKVFRLFPTPLYDRCTFVSAVSYCKWKKRYW